MQFGNRQGSGQVFLGKDLSVEPNYSDQVAYQIDEEMKRIVEECHEITRKVLMEHRDKLDALANILLEKETLVEEEIKAVMEG